MTTAGNYLYGFTNRDFQPAADLRGLAGAPLGVITYRDVSAIVSRHPVQKLMPSRANLEPHHRIVRYISSAATLVPAAFGHISESEQDLLAVLQGNHDEIRDEIARLEGKCEMGVRLSWSVDNIFLYFVQRDRELRELRDRAFRDRREPSMPEKIEIGGRFEAVVTRDRERCSSVLVNALNGIAREVSANPPRGDKTVCDIAVLIDRTAIAAFQAAVSGAAALFDQNFTIEYSGPWPSYSFVRLRLQRGETTAV
jgi:hypothetical protein